MLWSDLMLGPIVGAIGGGLGGAALAGRYLPLAAKNAVKTTRKGTQKASDSIVNAAARLDKYGAGGPGAIGAMGEDLQNIMLRGADTLANIPAAGLVRNATRAGVVGAGVGTSVLGANLGGVIDPEMPGSSNTLGSRMNMQQYPVMY